MTSKLKLDADALEVTSFDAGDDNAGATEGTVHGHVLTPACGTLDDCPISGDPSCSRFCQPPTAVVWDCDEA